MAYRGPTRDADLAQLVEHLICNQGVTGSSPVIGTSNYNNLAHLCRYLRASWGTVRGTIELKF